MVWSTLTGTMVNRIRTITTTYPTSTWVTGNRIKKITTTYPTSTRVTGKYSKAKGSSRTISREGIEKATTSTVDKVRMVKVGMDVKSDETIITREEADQRQQMEEDNEERDATSS